MKRNLCSILLLIIISVVSVLSLSSCTYASSIPDGRWESEYPHMYIDFGEECTGVLWNADGTVTKIQLWYLGGRFGISKMETEEDNSNSIYWGTQSLKGNTLIMDLRYGGRIVMKRVGPATVDGKEYP